MQAQNGGGATAFDRVVLDFLHARRHVVWDTLTYAMAFLGSLWVVFGAALAAIIADRAFQKCARSSAQTKAAQSEAGAILRRAGRVMPLAGVGGTLLVTAAKEVAHRPRPHEFAPLFVADGYSFPSGHAFLGTVVFGLIGYFAGKEAKRRGASPFACGVLAAGFALLIVSIGVSRIYAGVHYPTDVLAGWAGGGAIVLLCVRGFRAV